MKCYCCETKTEFIFCIEGAEGIIYENLQSDQYWTKADDHKFTLWKTAMKMNGIMIKIIRNL